MAEIINTLPQGTELRGTKNRYIIQRALGQGTFGITYLATTEMQVTGQLGSFSAKVQVAIKEFFMRDFNGRHNTEVTSSSQGSYFMDYKRKFMREAENLSKLQHPNIVKVLELFEANGTVYYVMEYVEGENLNEYLRRHPMNEDEACGVIMKVASAINYMHAEHNLLHLDLKPGNIMRRTKDGVIFLIDFGLSKSFADNGQPESSTSVGQGTMGYAPLEQTSYSKDKGNFLPTIDVYALGATLYKLLTNQTPPAASELLNDESLIEEELNRRQLSPGVIKVVLHAMQPRVKARTQSAQAFMDELQAIVVPQREETAFEEGTVFTEEKTDGTDMEETVIGKEKTEKEELPALPSVPSNSSRNKKTLVMVLAVLLVAGGIVWWVMSSRDHKDYIIDSELSPVVVDSVFPNNNDEPQVSNTPEPEKSISDKVNQKNIVKESSVNKEEIKEKQESKKEKSVIEAKQEREKTENDNEIAEKQEPSNETTTSSPENAEVPIQVTTPVAPVVEEVQEDDKIYDMVEENASFPGGEAACIQWISSNLKYPAIAKEQGVQGRVLVQIVVEKDGSITDANVIRSPDPSLSKEALRLVNQMPKWKPAHQGGKVVRSRYTLSVLFRLN